MRIKQSILVILGMFLVLVTVGTAAANQPPVADANGPYVVNESAVVTFDASGSFDPDGNIILYEWDLDEDGAYIDATGVTATYVYNDNYFITIAVRVTDEVGDTDIDTSTVTINNVPPDVDAGPDATIIEGDNFTRSVSFNDPGYDIWTATVQYGDGSPAESLNLSGKSFDISHVYAANGIYTVQVGVEDDDGGIGIDIFTVTVNEADIGIDLEKCTNGFDADTYVTPGIVIGDTVTWRYIVTNTGNVPLEDIVLTDDSEGLVSCPENTLSPGESMECEAIGTSEYGHYTNFAYVTGKYNGIIANDSDFGEYYGFEESNSDWEPPAVPTANPVITTIVLGSFISLVLKFDKKKQ